MLFRTGLRIPFLLAFVLAFPCFFSKVPTTEALKCFQCVSDKSEPGFKEKCKNPGPGDEDLITDCAEDYQVKMDFALYKFLVLVCNTRAWMKNGEMVFERICEINGKGELRKCLDDAKYPPTSGCAVANSTQEIAMWENNHTACIQKFPKESGQPAPAPKTGRNGQELPNGNLTVCSCTENLCNSITEDELRNPSTSGTVSFTRGCEGVIFSLTLLIHLYLRATLWN